MADEEKDVQTAVETAEAEEKPLDQPLEKAETESAPEHPENQVTEKRARLVSAGLIAAVVLSLIAVAVAGIFQLTLKWMIVCPTDLPVNDPAKVLWQEVVSEKDISKPLGVSGPLVAETKFKGYSAETEQR